MPHEHVDILESRSMIDADSILLDKIDYDVDVLVLGGGGAGTSAAILAAQGGADVLLATKLRHGDANTMMAEGGIQAADKENDSPAIHGTGTIQKELPAMFRQYIRFGINMAENPIIVYPTLHYQNGGIVIKDSAESEVPNLYVAGEASGGIHGRNRLMGNSLLDIIVFGRRAGKNAAEKAKTVNLGKLTLDHTRMFNQELEKQGLGQRVAPILLPDYRGKISG